MINSTKQKNTKAWELFEKPSMICVYSGINHLSKLAKSDKYVKDRFLESRALQSLAFCFPP
jgi:hypothetical protein